jgi:hypothetical protein
MVHLWVSLKNNRINRPCLNKRVTRIFLGDDSYFYGDYKLDIYIAGKEDYHNVDAVVRKVGAVAGGWVSDCRECERVELILMRDTMIECGDISPRSLPKLFPRKDGASIREQILSNVYRCDGNFKMIAWDTPRFYYVVCFDTS